MKDFRLREPTENPEVHKYVFSDKANAEGYVAKTTRYEELITKAKEGKGSLTDEDKREMAQLLREVTDYKAEQHQKIKSVLASSVVEESVGAGKDNRVVTSNEGYVYKYSVESYEPTPQTVEYLIKKYTMLKKFLGKYIPKSSFILGERRIAFDKKRFHKTKADNRTHVITMQRKVSGKTISQMTPDERERPELLLQLKEAHATYIQLKERLRKATERLKLPENTLDVKLDLGGLSKKDDLSAFDAEKIREYSTPNIMYDEDKEQLYFIDFDMNEWTADKQKIYDLVMSDEVF